MKTRRKKATRRWLGFASLLPSRSTALTHINARLEYVVFDGQPLHVGFGIKAASAKRDHMVNMVSMTGATPQSR